MLNNKYPEHDINEVLAYIAKVIDIGDCSDLAKDESVFLNRLFAALPPLAIEYGMQFLHGKRDLPSSCDEILPLYMRFINLLEYCEGIEALRVVPTNPTTEEIMKRYEVTSALDEKEKAFMKPLLGSKPGETITTKSQTVSSSLADNSAPTISSDNSNTNIANNINNSNDDELQTKAGSGLHLMNQSASILVCADPIRTCLFYEDKLGFMATHLSDETMPHIRLDRDNISIVLVEGPSNSLAPKPLREITIGLVLYDQYIYVSEPMLMQNELIQKGVTIVKELPSISSGNDSSNNREFVCEDIDGRYICFSQREFS